MNGILFILFCAALSVAGCRRDSTDSRAGASEGMQGATRATEAAWLLDATRDLGLRFVHAAGTNWFMPDQVGAGVVLQDFDNDGLVDLYLLQNNPSARARNALYQHQRDGTVKDVSLGSGADLLGRGMGAAAGDINNDGLADLVVTEYGSVKLLINRGALKFDDASAAAGLDDPGWAVPVSFLDYDRDGWLDIVVGNYLDYDPKHVCHDVQGRRDFCSPEAFPPVMTRLWRNVGGERGGIPRFLDVTVSSGLARVPGAALGLVAADFTGDGWPDILCSDDGRPNRLFVNQGNGVFVEEAAVRGLAFNSMGRTAANMGVAWADFDGDGNGDLFVTHLTEEFHSLYRQDRAGLFMDIISQTGIQQQAWRGTGFGTAAVDFNNDGWVDLAIANGLVSHRSAPQSPLRPDTDPWWAAYAQRSQMFQNEGGGRFRDRSSEEPILSGHASVGRSLAVGDWDQDGGMDLVLGNVAGPTVFMRNTAMQRGNWIQFRVVDPQHGSRDEIGAEVFVSVAGRSKRSVLQPATSYLSSHEPVLHFGLGTATGCDRVEVLWPDGSREEFSPTKANLRLVLRRGEGMLRGGRAQ